MPSEDTQLGEVVKQIGAVLLGILFGPMTVYFAVSGRGFPGRSVDWGPFILGAIGTWLWSLVYLGAVFHVYA